MNFIKKNWEILLVAVSIAGILLATMSNHNTKEPRVIYKDKIIYKTKVVYKDKVVYKSKDCNNSLLNITKETLYKDIKKYKGISDSTRKEILSYIFEYSKKYNENPLVIYSLIATESSFKFWIKHSLSTITIDKKKIQTRAIGLGAIIWEWWGKKLHDNNIASTKSDLFRIKNNIEATCFVFSELKNMPIMKGTNNNTESAMLRYFGGGSKNHWYVDKINKVLSGLMKQELYKK